MKISCRGLLLSKLFFTFLHFIILFLAEPVPKTLCRSLAGCSCQSVDENQYTCTCENGSKCLLLRGSPKIYIEPAGPYEVPPGGNINITCASVAYPFPEIYWQRYLIYKLCSRICASKLYIEFEKKKILFFAKTKKKYIYILKIMRSSILDILFINLRKLIEAVF